MVRPARLAGAPASAGESAKAREWAAAFAGNDLPGTNAAVMNAMRDQVFTLMQKVGPR